jgi:putative multiple sugar transport system ATP-binding protein
MFISSDLTEILGMCDRLYIMNEGCLVGEMTASEATQESIIQCIMNSAKVRR